MDLELDIRLGPWAEVRNELATGQIDALTGVSYSKERDQVFDVSVPHVSISCVIFVRKDSTIKGPEDVKGKEVLVVKEVYAHDWLKQNRFAARVVTVDRPQEALLLLSEGRHDWAVLIRLH